MTCIVGFVDRVNKEIIMGGDSAGVAGLEISKRKDTKVFIKDNKFIIGFTTSFRMGQILHYNPLHIEEQSSYEDDLAFMVKKFIPAVQDLFQKNYYGGIDQKQGAIGGTFLVGYKDNLYRIDSDFQVALGHKDYDSCGCGDNYALGSLHTSIHLNKLVKNYRNYDYNTEKIVLRSLITAAEFSAGVCSPFNIIKLKYK